MGNFKLQSIPSLVCLCSIKQIFFSLIHSETKVIRNNSIHTIPRISTEWSLSLTIRIEKSQLGYWKNLIHFSTGNDNFSRLPAIFLWFDIDSLYICYDINNNRDHCYSPGIKIGQRHNVEIHQRYISDGDYRYFIVFDGIEVYSVVNKQAKQFYNVQVFTADPWYAADDFRMLNLLIFCKGIVNFKALIYFMTLENLNFHTVGECKCYECKSSVGGFALFLVNVKMQLLNLVILMVVMMIQVNPMLEFLW